MIPIKPLSLALLAGAALCSTAQAALVDRGGGMLYDDVLDITWLQDANLARTSGFDADGLMTWSNAKAWADNLDFGGFTDWRLATMLDTGPAGCNSADVLTEAQGTDCGYNVQTASGGTVYSELAYMYYVNLGLKAVIDTQGNFQPDNGVFGNGNAGGQADVGLVRNLQSWVYWTGLESSSTSAWNFWTTDGLQQVEPKGLAYYAWAVRAGDVGATPPPGPPPSPGGSLPEPATLGLMGLALAGLAATRRPARQR